MNGVNVPQGKQMVGEYKREQISDSQDKITFKKRRLQAAVLAVANFRFNSGWSVVLAANPVAVAF